MYYRVIHNQEGAVVRVEVGWPIWGIISTWFGFEKGHKKLPVFTDVAGPGALGNGGVNQIGFNALFNILR